MASFLITHAYPVNNGDAALMRALHDALKMAGQQVKVATYHFDKVPNMYPEVDFIREPSDYFFFRKLPFLKPLWITLNYKLLSKYNKYDVYVACPGGFLNSYYHFPSAVKALEVMSKKKKTAVYAQSVGPFNEEDSTLFNALGKLLKIVLVRDEKSDLTMKKIGYPGKYLKTKDAAFLLDVKQIKERKKGKIAVSVREWKNDSRSMEAYISMITSFCVSAITQGKSVEFLSTCQGVKNYRDDSLTARLIANKIIALYPELSDHISVNSNYYNLDDLLQYLENFEYVIGTRLHMCILSLLKGIPAFNISYEFKGLECYKYLEIPQFSADFNEPLENSVKKFDHFLEQVDSLWPQIQQTIQGVKEEVKTDFQTFLEALELGK